jgi:hypothetical protein
MGNEKGRKINKKVGCVLDSNPRQRGLAALRVVLITGGADGKILRSKGKYATYSKIIIWFRIEKTHVVFVIYTGACRICAQSCSVFFVGRACHVKFVHSGF